MICYALYVGGGGGGFFFFFFFLMIRRPPRSTLFPYTRSSDLNKGGHGVASQAGGLVMYHQATFIMPYFNNRIG